MTSKIELSVLGYTEDGTWLAHCLEMDVIGYGQSLEEAMKSLAELIEMQVSFAVSQGHPQSLWNPAPPKYWMIYHSQRELMLSSYPAVTELSEYIPTHMEAPTPRKFNLAHA